jgi:hypothetical protein
VSGGSPNFSQEMCQLLRRGKSRENNGFTPGLGAWRG